MIDRLWQESSSMKSPLKFAAPLSLGAALLAAPVLAQSPAAPSPLATARTIQVQETLQRANLDGTLPPAYTVSITIQKPDHVKAVIASPGSKRPDLYVRDGKTEYQYDGRTNKYQANPLPTGGKSAAEVAGITLIDFLRTGGHFPPPPAGETRTIITDTVNGRQMTLMMDRQSINAGGGTTIVVLGKTWIDAKTHLPYRLLVTTTQKGVTKTYQDMTFSHWVFNKPIPTAQLAWTPPAGSVEFKDADTRLLAVGTPAPDFTAIAPDGHKVHLSDYKGKTVVLDFWATWCGPCQKSMPNLEKVYQQVKDKDVVVLGICAWDQKAAYDQWLTGKGKAYTFQTAFDPAGHASPNIAGTLYHASSIPTQYVVDKEGKVAAAYIGYEDGDTRLEKALVAQGVAVQSGQATAAAKTP